MTEYPKFIRKIMENGKIVKPHGSEAVESMHVPLVVRAGVNIFTFPPARKIDKIKQYLFKELAWYFSGERDSDFISEHAKLWKSISNEDGTANSNYGHLVFYNKTAHPSLGAVSMSPFEWAASRLRLDKDTRQAVITYNTGAFNFPENKDYICTQHQAFFIRENKLRCFIALRSSDAIFGLTYNMPWWSAVQQQLRLSLLDIYPDLELGDIEVDVYSAHVYSQHYELVWSMLACPQDSYFLRLEKAVPLGMDISWYEKNIESYFSLEKITKEKHDESEEAENWAILTGKRWAREWAEEARNGR